MIIRPLFKLPVAASSLNNSTATPTSPGEVKAQGEWRASDEFVESDLYCSFAENLLPKMPAPTQSEFAPVVIATKSVPDTTIEAQGHWPEGFAPSGTFKYSNLARNVLGN